MKLDKHVVDMFSELTKPTDDVKMEKTCFGTISIVDGTRYVKLDGSDLLVPAASTVKTSHGDRVTVLMRNHALTITGNLTAPATDGGSSATGTAATIEIGTVTTGEAGSSASVTNSGTTSKAVFDFVIPKGDKGDPGPQGPKGEKGDAGTWDGTIPEHTHDVSDITDFPESLPANGGNADTLDGLHANEIASNPNLLINPDFKINQRGLASYSASGYTVDRWLIGSSAKLAPHDGYVTFESTASKATPPLYQKYENPSALSGKTVTLSFDYDLKTEGAWMSIQAVTNGYWTPSPPVYITETGRSVKSTVINLPDNLTDLRVALIIHGTDSAPLAAVDIYGAKLELGKIATPIILPNPAIELLKIQSMDNNDGIKLVSNDTLPTIMNSQMVSNPNLLDNPDFKINQRGQSEYSQSANGIKRTVDRWAIYKTSSTESGAITITPNSSGGAVLNNQTDGKALMYQRIENFSDLFGKQVTYSASINGSILSLTTTYTNTTGQCGNVTWTGDKTAYIRIYTVLDTYIQFEIYLNAGASITVDWTKVEIGGVATPFVPPNPALELTKCQRYLWALTSNSIRLGCANVYANNFAAFYINTPTVLRTVPTVSFENMALLLRTNGNVAINIDGIRVAGMSSNIIKMYINIASDSDSLLTIGEWYDFGNQPKTTGILIFNAEI